MSQEQIKLKSRTNLKLGHNFKQVFDGNTNAEVRYGILEPHRETFIQDGQLCSMLTFPEVLPYYDRNYSENPQTYVPWSSVGAQGVSALSSEFHLKLFPPNVPFFRIEVDEIAVRMVEERKNQEIENAIAAGVSPNQLPSIEENSVSKIKADVVAIERNLMKMYNAIGIDHVLKEVFVHLLITGNILLEIRNTYCRTYGLDQYVINRTPSGDVEEILIKEMISISNLPDKVVEKYKQRLAVDEKNKDQRSPKDDATVYTWVKFNYKDGYAYSFKTIFNEVIEGTEEIWPIGGCPYIPCRFTAHHNEDYGRAYVMQVHADLQVMNAMTRAVARAHIESCRLLKIMAADSGFTTDSYMKAPVGSVLQGRPGSILPVETGKLQEIQAAYNYMKETEHKINRFFARPESAERKGERVTAYEWEQKINALQSTNAGTYSVIAREVQTMIVTRLMFMALQAQKIPEAFVINFDNDNIMIKMFTGLAAVGRHEDYTQLRTAAQEIVQLVGPQQLPEFIHLNEFFSRIFTSLGVNSDNLVVTAEEQAQRQQAAQEQQQQQEALAQEQEDKKIAANSPVVKEVVKQGMEDGSITPGDIAGASQQSPTSQEVRPNA